MPTDPEEEKTGCCMSASVITGCYLRIRFIERPLFRVLIDPALEKLQNTEKKLSNKLGLENKQ